MNPRFLAFMEWVMDVLRALFDLYLEFLAGIKLLEIIRRHLGEA